MEALFATDVLFQQCRRLTALMEESKQYFCGEHPIYGYETKIIVLLNGLAIRPFSKMVTMFKIDNWFQK